MAATDTSSKDPIGASLDTYRQEVAAEGAKELAAAEGVVAEAKTSGQQQVDLAQQFAAQEQPFTQEPPHEQIQQVMAGAPFLFALAAIGGKLSGAGGIAMLDSLNGMSDGIIKGDQEALENNYKNYQAQFDKWKVNSDNQFKKYQILQQAYAGQADGNIRALTAALNVTRDISDRKLTADDPAKYWELKSKIEDAHARTIEAYARASEAKTKAKLAEGGGEGSVENTAQMIASYQMAPLSSYALRSPWGQQVMSEVKNINPDYQAAEFGSRSKAYRDFATGKQGDQARSLNVAVSHLDTVAQLAAALDNGDIKLLNSVGQTWAAQTGNPAPTNFDAARHIVTTEVIKGVIAGGGGVTERQEAEGKLDRAMSESALSGVVNTYQALLGGQLKGLKGQYERTTGRKDFERLVSEDVQQTLDKASAKPTPSTAAPSGAAWVGIDPATGETMYMDANGNIIDQSSAGPGAAPAARPAGARSGATGSF